MPRIKEKALKTELAKHGFESVSLKRELPGGRVEVEANKLHPVHVEEGESVYAPIPVSLSVERHNWIEARFMRSRRLVATLPYCVATGPRIVSC